MRRQLIVNADDFGLHESVNDAIEHAHRAGILTSASLVVNGTAFEHAVKIAKRNPTLGVGIHLTLSGERPVLPVEEVPSLLDGNQLLRERHTTFCWDLLRGKIRLQEVVRECKAQITRFFATGLHPTHVDSHRHLHVFPPVFGALSPLLLQENLTAIRWLTVPSFEYRTLNLPKAAVALLAQWNRPRRHPRFRSPDYFVGFGRSGSLDARYLRSVLPRLRPGVTELSLHPGTNNDALGQRYQVWRDVHRWACHWEQEYQALLDPTLKQLVAEHQIHLMTYDVLASADMPIRQMTPSFVHHAD